MEIRQAYSVHFSYPHPGFLTSRNLATWGKMTGLLPPAIFLQQLTQALVGQRFDSMIVAAGHALVIHQRVHDRFFGPLKQSRAGSLS